MKKISFILLLILLSVSINSKAQLNYLFSASSKPYVAVEGGIAPQLIMVPPFNANPPWTLSDEGFAQVPVGFTFNYDGKDVTKASICANGFITLGDTLFRRVSPLLLYRNTLAGNPFYVDGVKPVLAPFWDDLDLVDTHNLVYKTTGHAPFRVFTVEWKRTRWTFESTTPALSMEVKLYEKTNVIEFHYKDEGGMPYTPRAFASIGITSSYSSRGFISVQDASANPAISVVKAMDSLTSKPATNQVYTFTPAVVSIPQDIFPSISYTSSKVSFNLKANGENKYEYAVTRSPISPASGTETKSESLEANGLSAATTYYIYGRAVKNKNFRSQWTADSFTTAVNPVNVPWHISGNPFVYPYTPPDMRLQNNFGHSATTYSDKDWTTLTDFPNYGDTSIWSLNTFYGETGNSWLFSPGLKLTTGKTYQLKFGYFSFFIDRPDQVSSLEIKYGKATGAVAMTEGTLFKNEDISLHSYDDIALLRDTIIELTPDVTAVYYFGFHNLTPFTGEYGNVVPVITNVSIAEKQAARSVPFVLSGKAYNNDNILNWMRGKSIRCYEVQRSDNDITFKTLEKMTPNFDIKKIAEIQSKLKIYTGSRWPDLSTILGKELNGKGIHKPDFEVQKDNFKNLVTSLQRKSIAPQNNYKDYIDRNAIGTNYYRIKQVDKFGRTNYSNSVKLDNNKLSLKVYPNPAKDLLNVRIPSGKNKEITLIVTDASGRTVLTKNIRVIKGENNIQLDVSHINTGTYFVKIVGNGVNENTVVKFGKK